MKQSPKTNYIYKAMLCIIIFFIAILSAYQPIHQSINSLLALPHHHSELLHIGLIFFIPIYLAALVFGFGILSVYCASKIDQFFE